MGAAAYATLDTEEVVSLTRTALVDFVASLHGSDGGVIAHWKCINYLQPFMTLWKMLCLNGLVI